MGEAEGEGERREREKRERERFCQSLFKIYKLYFYKLKEVRGGREREGRA